MVPIGLLAYLSFKIKKILPNKEFYFISFLLGTFFPDIDIILSILFSTLFYNNYSIYLLQNSFSHSIIFIGIIYLFFLIIYETKKDRKILDIASGFIAGLFFHIMIDIIFSFESINVFWPLPIAGIRIWTIDLGTFLVNTLLALEFLFFRLFASLLINEIINNTNNTIYIKKISLWMKCEGYLFITFIILLLLLPQYILIIFGVFYLPSYIMSIYFIYKLRSFLN